MYQGIAYKINVYIRKGIKISSSKCSLSSAVGNMEKVLLFLLLNKKLNKTGLSTWTNEYIFKFNFDARYPKDAAK